MAKYNVNEDEYDLKNRREVTLTGFSSNVLDDVLLRATTAASNDPTLNGDPGMIGGVHAITKDAKIVNLEGESPYRFYVDRFRLRSPSLAPSRHHMRGSRRVRTYVARARPAPIFALNFTRHEHID